MTPAASLSYLQTLGNALVTSGYFDYFYCGFPSQIIPNAQRKILTLDVDYIEETRIPDDIWTGRFIWEIRMADARAGTDVLIGSGADRGLMMLVDVVKETVDLNLRNHSQIGRFSWGRERRGLRNTHPKQAYQFQLDIEAYVNPRDRDSTSADSIVIPAFQSQSLTQLSDVTVSSPATDDILVYTGSNFQNVPGANYFITSGDTSATTISGADDMNPANLAAGQLLVWSGGSSNQFYTPSGVTITEGGNGAFVTPAVLGTNPTTSLVDGQLAVFRVAGVMYLKVYDASAGSWKAVALT